MDQPAASSLGCRINRRLVTLLLFLSAWLLSAQGPSWSGRWVGTWNQSPVVLELRQAGLAVTGDYQIRGFYDGGRITKGHFQGQVDARNPKVLKGTLVTDPWKSPDGTRSVSGTTSQVEWVLETAVSPILLRFAETPWTTLQREGEPKGGDPKGPKAPEPPPAECAWTADQKLAEILRRYMAEIPKGRCSNGMINNVKSLLDPSLEGFRCGGYQGKVLDLLDRLRMSRKPGERCLMDAFDYGPIEIGVGLHQAVVIYRRGEDWKWKGQVLDPWFNQTPEVYGIAAWQLKSCVSLGSAGGCTVHGASWLGGWGFYPTLGKPYPGDEAPPRPRSAEKRGRIAVNCPLAPCLVDDQGRVSGYRNGQMLGQIPGVACMSVMLSDGTPWTEFEFTPSPGLQLQLLGTGAGPAVVVTSLAGSPRQYRMNVRSGEAFALPVAVAGSALSGPRGRVEAEPFTAASAEALGSRLRLGSGDATARKTYRHVEGAFRVALSPEWTVRERTPDPTFDMLLRSPDRDGCAIYLGRDHEAVSAQGLRADLEVRRARLMKPGADAQASWSRIGPAQVLQVAVHDAKGNLMLWHLCLGHRDRIYYIDIESLPGTGRRELPAGVREVLDALLFEQP